MEMDDAMLDKRISEVLLETMIEKLTLENDNAEICKMVEAIEEGIDNLKERLKSVNQSYKKAAYWIKRAIDQNHTEATLYLSLMYYCGWGVEKDEEMGAKLMRKYVELKYGGNEK